MDEIEQFYKEIEDLLKYTKRNEINIIQRDFRQSEWKRW